MAESMLGKWKKYYTEYGLHNNFVKIFFLIISFFIFSDSFAQKYPDLKHYMFGFVSVPRSGQTTEWNHYIYNQGDTTAASSVLQIYFSPDTIKNYIDKATDILILEHRFPPLKERTMSDYIQLPVTIPELPVGSKWKVLALIDAYNEIIEPKYNNLAVGFIYRIYPPLGKPNLIEPTNGSSQNLPLTFKWSKSKNATGYELMYSLYNFYGNLERIYTTDTTAIITNLSRATTYYWKVRPADDADNAQGYADSEIWSFYIKGETVPLSVPLLESPLNGSINISTNPSLYWGHIYGAMFYHLQVSTNQNFTSIVYENDNIKVFSQNASGLSSDVSNLNNNTIYYWRVRARNDGGLSSWSSTWSFKTQAADTAPSIPTLLSPSNGSSNLSTNPTLSWNATGGAASYQLQVSINSNFSTTIFDQSNLSSTSQQVTGLSNSKTYYWRVNATNSYGTSGWSSTWLFTTQAAGTAPSIPTLLSPSNTSSNLSTNPTLSWNASNGATSYQLQVSTNSNFSTTIFDQSNISNTSQQVTGLSNSKTYYWRVNATNSYGTSGWSSTWSFKTQAADTAPSIPTLLSPSNGSSNLSTNPTLSWNATGGAASYQLQVSINSNFSTTIFDQSNLSSTSQQVTGLSNSKTYYWRVNATNNYGTSPWSNVWSFTTQTTIGVTILISPPDGTTNVSIKPLILKWKKIIYAEYYEVEVSKNLELSQLYANPYTSDTLWNAMLPFDAENTLFYWRVRGKYSYPSPGQYIYGQWSSTWSFTTSLATSINQNKLDLPERFSLFQNYPNPFNLSTTIRYSVSTRSFISITIYDIFGREVRRLVNEEKSIGQYEVLFIADNLTSGIYYCRLQSVGYTETRKIILIK